MLGVDKTIIKDDDINLWDASNRKMDFAGRCLVTFDIPKLQQKLSHEFAVLNIRTYKTFLLGRDFFRKMGPVTFEVAHNRIKIGGRWIKGDEPNKECVRMRGSLTIPARSEQFVCVSGHTTAAMLDHKFIPGKIFPHGILLKFIILLPDSKVDAFINISPLSIKVIIQFSLSTTAALIFMTFVYRTGICLFELTKFFILCSQLIMLLP